MTVYPDYYPQFRCLASACRHTCCAGWEIDVDDASLARYRALPGELGERLRDAVETDGGAHFRLTEDERCPFLNRENLCELILAGGEALLCQICTDHPRFRSFFTGRTEIGIGLCCEAAAKLILTRREPVRLCCSGEETALPAEEQTLLRTRDALLRLAQDRSLSIRARENRLLALCGVTLPPLSALSALYASLERMDDDWTRALALLHETDLPAWEARMGAQETEYEQLLVYFLYRHVPPALQDGALAARIAFSVLSTRLLRLLAACTDASDAQRVEYARLYSSEIEYSQDNLDALFAALTPQ